jgi:histidine racemase
MKNLEYVICSPSGNITALIFTKVPNNLKPQVARLIMQALPDIEQVGFVEKPKDSRSASRLEMMGGEFCGNAACALVWVLWEKKQFQKGLVEISGAQKPLHANVYGKKVEVEVPVRPDLSCVQILDKKTIVDIEGIRHIIVEGKPPELAYNEAKKILAGINLDSVKAAGVLYTEITKQTVYMKPFVWVRDTNTIIEESACASGSVCVAMWQAVLLGKETLCLKVRQPSGNFLEAFIEIKAHAFKRASIAGEVKILSEGLFPLSM